MTDDGLENVEELDVDGMKDRTRDIWYIGKAYRQPDGKWRCLADVNGALCLVEVRIRKKDGASHDQDESTIGIDAGPER